MDKVEKLPPRLRRGSTSNFLVLTVREVGEKEKKVPTLEGWIAAYLIWSCG